MVDVNPNPILMSTKGSGTHEISHIINLYMFQAVNPPPSPPQPYIHGHVGYTFPWSFFARSFFVRSEATAGEVPAQRRTAQEMVGWIWLDQFG